MTLSRPECSPSFFRLTFDVVVVVVDIIEDEEDTGSPAKSDGEVLELWMGSECVTKSGLEELGLNLEQ